MTPAALRRGTVSSGLVWHGQVHPRAAMASPPSPGSSTGSCRVVNMLEAKTHLPRLVEAIETGAEAEVVIARAQFVAPDCINAANPLNAELFEPG